MNLNHFLSCLISVFLLQVINERKQYLEELMQNAESECFERKRLALIDLLLTASDEGKTLDLEDVRSEIYTFFFAVYTLIAFEFHFGLSCLHCFRVAILRLYSLDGFCILWPFTRSIRHDEYGWICYSYNVFFMSRRT